MVTWASQERSARRRLQKLRASPEIQALLRAMRRRGKRRRYPHMPPHMMGDLCAGRPVERRAPVTRSPVYEAAPLTTLLELAASLARSLLPPSPRDLASPNEDQNCTTMRCESSASAARAYIGEDTSPSTRLPHAAVNDPSPRSTRSHVTEGYLAHLHRTKCRVHCTASVSSHPYILTYS
jgi:hypothetical protein